MPNTNTIYTIIKRLTEEYDPTRFSPIDTYFTFVPDTDFYSMEGCEPFTEYNKEAHPRYGIKHTEESKRRISESLMGKPAIKPEGFSEKCRLLAIKMNKVDAMKHTLGHRKGCAPANKGHRSYDKEEMKRLYDDGNTYKQISDHIGCGYNTVRRYLNE